MRGMFINSKNNFGGKKIPVPFLLLELESVELVPEQTTERRTPGDGQGKGGHSCIKQSRSQTYHS